MRVRGGVSRWPLWSLPPDLRRYLIAVVAIWLGAVVWAARSTPNLSAEQWFSAALLVACGVATIEATEAYGQASGRLWRNMTGAWTLPMLMLLPPQYALVVPVALQLVSQLRAARSLPHRVVFSAAAVGLASGAAAWVFHGLTGPTPALAPEGDVAWWVVAGVLAGVIRVVLNMLLVAIAVRRSDPEVRWRDLVWSRDGSAVDLVEISAGLTVAGLCLVAPWLAILTVPALVYMVARHAMASQLETLATTDHKTGVLTPGAWERAAAVAVARAHRSGRPIAVLMLDVDEFKQVNDTHGHLIGDVVLRSLALELQARVRSIDLVGRFGGDEFAVLLHDVTGDDAYDIADRLRQHIADLAVSSLTGELVRVTVSVGVVGAVDTPPSRVDVTDLLTAADHALYTSKRSGRNRVHRLSIGG